MAALLVAALLVTFGHRSLGARVAPDPSRADGDGGCPVDGLPVDLQQSVLRFVPWWPRVAWATGAPDPVDRAAAVIRPGGMRDPVMIGGHAGGFIKQPQFFPGGDRLLTLGRSGSFAIWDLRSGRLLLEQRLGAWIFDAQIFPCGERVVTIGADARLVIWSAATGEALRVIDATGAAKPRSVRILAEDRLFIVGAVSPGSETIVLWSVAEGRRLQELAPRQTTSVRLVEVSACGTRVVTAGSGPVLLWSDAGHFLRDFGTASTGVAAIGVSRGGRHVVWSKYGAVFVVCGATGRLLQELVVGPGFARVAFLQGGPEFAIVSSVGVSVWDVVRGQRLRDLALGISSPHVGIIHIAASADGRVITACGTPWTRRAGMEVGWVIVWDAVTGRVLHQAEEPHVRSQDRSFCGVAVGPTSSVADALAD